MANQDQKIDKQVTLSLKNRTASEYGKAVKVSSGATIQFHFKKFDDGLHRFIIEESDDKTVWKMVPLESLSESPPVLSGADQGNTKEVITYKGKKKYLRVNAYVEGAIYGSLYEVKITNSWVAGCLVLIVIVLILLLGSCVAFGDKEEEKKQKTVPPAKQETAEKTIDKKEEPFNEKKNETNKKEEDGERGEKEERKQETNTKEESSEKREKKSPTSKRKRDDDDDSASLSTKKKRSSGCYIKGNINSSGEKIYHVPGGQFYSRTDPEECFESETAARAAGYRKSKR